MHAPLQITSIHLDLEREGASAVRNGPSGALEGLRVFPASHHVLPEAERARVLSDVRAELEARLEELRRTGRFAEADRLRQRVGEDLEAFVKEGYCKGLENYSRHLCGRPAGAAPLTLLDFFPRDFLLLVDESHVSLPQLRAMHPADRRRKLTLVEHGFRLPSALDNRPLTVDEFWERVPSAVFVSATPAAFEMSANELEPLSELVIRPTAILDPVVTVRPLGAQVDELLAEATARAARGERTLATVLTRVGAERLAEFLNAHGVPAAYMHSGTKSLERVRILKRLREGEICALVGVNLLREGLDLPEVSLVAVLDADKEGFLRSTTSLVQTIGRAARRVNGAAILFADRVTGSMQRAMDETSRRRAVQSAYNARNGLVPTPISRAAEGSPDMLDLLDEARARRKAERKPSALERGVLADRGVVSPAAPEISGDQQRRSAEAGLPPATSPVTDLH